MLASSDVSCVADSGSRSSQDRERGRSFSGSVPGGGDCFRVGIGSLGAFLTVLFMSGSCLRLRYLAGRVRRATRQLGGGEVRSLSVSHGSPKNKCRGIPD